MNSDRGYFRPEQAREVARAFRECGVDYMFIGKSGAILLGYPAATQDVDLFVRKSVENGHRIVDALGRLEFEIDEQTAKEIISGKDFVQLKNGPFDLDLVFAPDGIPSFDEAKQRMHVIEGYPVASLRDIIASKRASNRKKDRLDLDLLEKFRLEFEKNLRGEPRSAVEIALEKTKEEAE